jgi:hypothetical protein
MTTTTNPNGRVRQSLASQIDRLDSILDGLAEAINETVVAAVQAAVGQAVREAVQATLAEVLTNPQLRPLLQPAPAATDPVPAPERRPVLRRVGSWLAGAVTGAWSKTVGAVRLSWSRTTTALRLACGKTVAVVRSGAAAVVSKARQVYRRTAALLHGGWLRAQVLWQLARRLGRPMVMALGVGTVVAAGCYLAGPAVASVVSGLASLALTLTALLLRPFWPLLQAGPGDPT